MTMATGARPWRGFTGRLPVRGGTRKRRCRTEPWLFLCESPRKLNPWQTRPTMPERPHARRVRRCAGARLARTARYSAETKPFGRHIGQLHALPTLHPSEVEGVHIVSKRNLVEAWRKLGPYVLVEL